MQQLVMAVSEAEKCANVAAQLVSKKARTRSVDPQQKGGGGVRGQQGPYEQKRCFIDVKC